MGEGAASERVGGRARSGVRGSGDGGWIEAGLAHARRYNQVFRARLRFNQCVVRIGRRDGLARFCKARGTGTAIHDPKPLHLRACLAFLGYKDGDVPEAERASHEALGLPIDPEPTDPMFQYVVQTVHAVTRGR